MNMNQIVNMFTRLVMRKAMNWGINKGMSTLSKSRAPKAAPPPMLDDDGNPVETARQPGDGKNRKQARQMAQQVKTINRMTRR